MTTAEWPCPRSVMEGDVLEVATLDSMKNVLPDEPARIKILRSVQVTSNGLEFYGEYLNGTFVGERWSMYTDPEYNAWRLAQPSFEPMQFKPVKYGATCKRCNEFNEHAEASASFTCYGCRR